MGGVQTSAAGLILPVPNERAYLLLIGPHCRRPKLATGAFEAPDANLTNLTPATAAGPGARERPGHDHPYAASLCFTASSKVSPFGRDQAKLVPGNGVGPVATGGADGSRAAIRQRGAGLLSIGHTVHYEFTTSSLRFTTGCCPFQFTVR